MCGRQTRKKLLVASYVRSVFASGTTDGSPFKPFRQLPCKTLCREVAARRKQVKSSWVLTGTSPPTAAQQSCALDCRAFHFSCTAAPFGQIPLGKLISPMAAHAQAYTCSATGKQPRHLQFGTEVAFCSCQPRRPSRTAVGGIYSCTEALHFFLSRGF